MSNDSEFEFRRAILAIAFGLSTLVASIALRLQHPDETWARCWLDHPGDQVGPTVLLVATLVVLWWPRGGAR